MQGRGVTNYSTSKPSHQFTTNTTEFDDALLSRGIITMEQAMLAKGATQEEAHRLVQLKRTEKKQQSILPQISPLISNYSASDDEDHLDPDDIQFMNQYRNTRLEELQSAHAQIITSISRSEWTRCVNEKSKDGTWVLVFLNYSSSSSSSSEFLESCIYMERHVFPNLALKHKLHMVQIPAHHAIPNWPEVNLPTLFIYRFGVLQFQLVGWEDFGIGDSLPDSILCFDRIVHHLESKLYQFGVIDLHVSNKNTGLGQNRQFNHINHENHWGQFSGQMIRLKTASSNISSPDYLEENAYDDVD